MSKFWTKEKCFDAASKCKTKKEFKEKYCGAYTAARRNNWIIEIWETMIPLGNLYNRCIYAYEFPDNYVYIGLTYNLQARNTNHYNKKYKSSVLIHENKSNNKPVLKQLTDYIDYRDAAIMEVQMINEYKNNNWKILNKKAGGDLGGHILLWTKEKCLEAASKCKTKNEFLQKFRGAHKSATINGWLDEIQKSFICVIKPKNYWTIDNCEKIVLSCKTKKELREKYLICYQTIHRNKWTHLFNYFL